MKQTKQLMEQILTIHVKNLTDEQAVKIYQECKQSEIIAKYFIQFYPTLYAIVTKFRGGTTEDRISAVLSGIDRALSTYRFDKNTKLSTYIITNVRQLVQLVYWNNYTTKGKKDAIVHSLDGMKEFYDDEDFENQIVKSYLQDYTVISNDIDFITTVQTCGLTDLQLAICNRLMSCNKVMVKELCEEFNITTKQFVKERINIRKKLSFLL